MPLFGCFTPFGQLQFSGDTSEAQKIYESMKAGYTDPKTGKAAIDMTPGTHAEAKLYATAMAIAAAKVTTQRAGNNLTPASSYEMLRSHGDRYGVRPQSGESVKEYRDEVDLASRAGRGSRHEFMVNGLATILGSALIKYRITSQAEALKWPSDPSLGPGVFSRPDLPPKTVRLLGPVTPLTFPSSVTIAYENWETNEPEVQISKGDVLCIEAENLAQAEKITVTAVAGIGDERTFTAVFSKSHDQFASASTGPIPLMFSTRRLIMIVVTAAAAADPDLVRRVDEFMHRNVKGVTQWVIVQPSSPGATTMGPFTLNLSPLGAVPIGTVTI